MAEPQAKGFDEFPLVAEGENGADPFAEFPIAGSSAMEKVGAFGQGATGALLETGGTLAGMAMGAQIGALGGPAAPVTVPLGAAVGAGAGFVAGGGLKRLFGVPSVEEMPQDQRPFGVAGEVVGGSVPFAAAPLAAARAGARLPASRVGSFINRIIDFAAESPLTFTAAETAAASGAAVGGAVAEAFRPGEAGPRIAGEIAGGFFNPTRLLVGASRGGIDAARMAIQSMSQAGRETRAAKILQEYIEQAGEDPKLLAQLLRDSGLPGIETTAAQKTGSPALIALEAKLAQESAKFGAEAGKMAEESLATIRNLVTALRGTGDPAALSAAAEMRAMYFRTLLAGRLQQAERQAVEAAQRIAPDTPRARAELSARANELLTRALEDARRVESELWDAVPRDVRASARGILERHAQLRETMLPEESMPPVIEGFVERLSGVQGRTTSGELILFRSRALSLARDAEAQGRFNDARVFGSLAEAALEDLDRMATEPVFGAYGRTAEGYNDARAFSRALHETFTRTFAGTAMQTTARGADRVPPELLLRRALGSGGEGAEVRLRELDDATRFLVDQGIPGTEENARAMVDAQARLIRLAAAEAIDPNTGRVSATRLGRFIQQNEGLLDRFPEIRADLQGAVQSEMGLQEMQRVATGVSRVMETQTAFAKIAKVENPVDAVASAIRGRNPVGDLTAFAKVARRGGAQALDGLRASIWDHAISQATDSSGAISFEKLRNVIFNPVRPGEMSLAQIMRREGLMTTQEQTRFTRLLGEAQKIESALQSGTDLETVMKDPDALFDLVLRVAGSKLGAAMASGTSGATLIAAGRGSSFARSVFEKVPQTRVKEVLIAAAKDPRLMAALLEKPAGQKEGIRIARQIHAYLLQAGITAEEGDMEADPGEGGGTSNAPFREAAGDDDVFGQPVSDEDVAQAMQAGMLYGTGNEEFAKEKVGKDFSGENYTAAYKLVNKSALMALGYDPRVHVLDDAEMDRASNSGKRVSGTFSPAEDKVVTRGEHYKMFNPVVLAHEFGHRGLLLLHRAYPDNDDVAFVFDNPEWEEAIVRALHHRAAGTKPTKWELENFQLLKSNKLDAFISDIEKLAQQRIKERRPGGPR